jgi:hypothetical protein
MKAFLEITDWADTEFNCNHVYWMDDSKNKMHAYARFGNPNDTQTFNKPIAIDTRGRKFVEVRNDIYKWTDLEDVIPATVNPTWRVAGSKGAEYVVEKDGSVYTCTCPGFKFRGACRHVQEVESNA